MSETVQLKKYANRRLYNTANSTYVTLEQVAAMIKEGKTIEVVDAQTKENVTGFILTQVILEESKKQAMLPVSLLHLLIRYGDNFLSEFFNNYLEETLKIYINSKIAFDQYFRQWLQMGMDLSSMSPENTKSMNPWASMFKFFESDQEEKDQNPKENK